MNARELFDLYKPLWEKVPEARPSQMAWNPDGPKPWPSYEGKPCFTACGYAPCEGSEMDFELPVEIAAALCRVAVEDWLASKGFAPMLIPPGHTTTGNYIVNTVARDATSRSYHGPTIHHALVAAALAVKGVG